MKNKVCCCLRFSFAVLCGVRYGTALRLVIFLDSLQGERAIEKADACFSCRFLSGNRVGVLLSDGMLQVICGNVRHPPTTAPNTQRSEIARVEGPCLFDVVGVSLSFVEHC